PERLEPSANRGGALGKCAHGKRRREAGPGGVAEQERQVAREAFHVGTLLGLSGPLTADACALEERAQSRVAAVAHPAGEARERGQEPHEKELVAETLLAMHRDRRAGEIRAWALLRRSPVPGKGLHLSVHAPAEVHPTLLVAAEREADPGEV